jgi:hypothetical protein
MRAGGAPQAAVPEQASELGGRDLVCSCKTFQGLQSQFSRLNTEYMLVSELFTQLKRKLFSLTKKKMSAVYTLHNISNKIRFKKLH